MKSLNMRLDFLASPPAAAERCSPFEPGLQMQTNDPRLQVLEVDGQPLYVPSASAWAELWEEPALGNMKLPIPDFLRKRVQATAPYAEITPALGFACQRVHFYELLSVNGAFYRVFIEAVFCDHCGHRAVISATPGVAEIYWGSQDEVAARNRSYGLGLLSCFACERPLARRPTVWQINAMA